MRGIPPTILNKFSPEKQAWLLKSPGYDFYSKFLMVKGCHLLIVGNTGAGKTQKGYWVVSWLKELETIVWVDAGKNEEIIPLFYMGKPVRIICPIGTTLIFEGLPAELQPEIIPVAFPGDAWYAVKRDAINIFAFRNTIIDEGEKARWMSLVFQALAFKSRMSDMPHIFPLSIFIDEAQWIVTSHRIKSNESRTKAAEVITENALEIRGYGGRIIMLTQSFKNITVASRENMPAVLIGRRAEITSGDSKVLSERSQYCGRYKCHQGLFVFPDGDINPWNCPWAFPFYQTPEGIKVRYVIGKPDEDEIEQEMIPLMSRFNFIPGEIEQKFSRYENAVAKTEMVFTDDEDDKGECKGEKEGETRAVKINGRDPISNSV
jgi:hypothetical protein